MEGTYGGMQVGMEKYLRATYNLIHKQRGRQSEPLWAFETSPSPPLTPFFLQGQIHSNGETLPNPFILFKQVYSLVTNQIDEFVGAFLLKPPQRLN